jgi:hypothetical protein
MFSIAVELDGLNWKADTLADSAADLELPLKIFGGYLRKRALARYAAQSFPGLAASTIEKRVAKGLKRLERKLQRDLRQAFKRARLARGPQRRSLLERVLDNTAVRHAMEDSLGSKSRGVQNRLSVLAEFQRQHRAGSLVELAQGKPLSIKQQASLQAREERAVDKAVGAPILGQLPKTLQVVVDGGSVTLRSRTHETWSKAQNDGATVGHGAQLPERKTIELEQDDLEVLVAILKHHILLPVQEGMHGPGF